MSRMPALLASILLATAHAAAKPDAGKPPAPRPATTKAAAKDGGVTTQDAGIAANDAGVRGEAPKDAGSATKAEASYAIKAVPAPDKATERLWKSKCGACHGVDGKAQTEKGKKMLMADFTAAAFQTHHTNDELKKAIGDGQKFTRDGVLHEMDAFSSEVTPAQADALLGYVRWLGAPH